MEGVTGNKKNCTLFVFITCISVFSRITTTSISHSITYPVYHDTAAGKQRRTVGKKKERMASSLGKHAELKHSSTVNKQNKYKVRKRSPPMLRARKKTAKCLNRWWHQKTKTQAALTMKRRLTLWTHTMFAWGFTSKWAALIPLGDSHFVQKVNFLFTGGE